MSLRPHAPTTAPSTGVNRIQFVLAASNDTMMYNGGGYSSAGTVPTNPMLQGRMSDHEVWKRWSTNGTLSGDRRPAAVQVAAFQNEVQFRNTHGWMSEHEWNNRSMNAIAGVSADDSRDWDQQKFEYRRELARRNGGA